MDQGQTPWLALKVHSAQQLIINERLQADHFQTFVPMIYFDWEDDNGRHHRKLKPAVSNLVFVAYGGPKAFEAFRKRADFAISVVRKSPLSSDYALIPASEMAEFMQMCNPTYDLERHLLTADEARLKAGDEVRVTRGPLEGLHGRLVRKNKKYFLLKEITGGLGVMVKVARWVCEKVEK